MSENHTPATDSTLETLIKLSALCDSLAYGSLSVADRARRTANFERKLRRRLLSVSRDKGPQAAVAVALGELGDLDISHSSPPVLVGTGTFHYQPED